MRGVTTLLPYTSLCRGVGKHRDNYTFTFLT